MRAMILAAGRGERMGALTATRPKPMLEVDGKPLIEHTLRRLTAAGINEIVINLAYLGGQIREHLGDGSRFNASIAYSEEPLPAYDTGGGIRAALPLLGGEPFIAINGDVWTDFPFGELRAPAHHAHLVLVPNPSHNPDGDFYIDNRRIVAEGRSKATFSGIGVYSPALFSGTHPRRFALAPLLRTAITQQLVSGEIYRGLWIDVGTPARFARLKQLLQHNNRGPGPV